MSLVVAFEGLPGSGKTTAIATITEALRSRGLSVEVADIETVGCIPVLRPIAKQYPVGSWERIVAYWLIRLEQNRVLVEMLERGADIIIADRFWGSTVATDLYGHRVPQEVLAWVGAPIQKPDLTLYFDASCAIVRCRRQATTTEDIAFATRVLGGYQQLAKELSWVRIDAAPDPETVARDCLTQILNLLGT